MSVSSVCTVESVWQVVGVCMRHVYGVVCVSSLVCVPVKFVHCGLCVCGEWCVSM